MQAAKGSGVIGSLPGFGGTRETVLLSQSSFIEIRIPVE